MDKAKLIDKLSSRLPENTRHMLDALLAAADESRTAVYLVGGPVRDLLLEHPSLDVDVVVEGDAIALARETSDALGARVVTHRHFGTATVKTPGFALDLATAREETYARPGALPTVRPASILADLARRDFTVNAMALALNGDRRGDLLDPHGGRADLVAAARGLARDAAAGRLDPAAITEATVASRLATAGLPDPDLLIRTGGEVRVSNFLLWQIAYTELVFTPRFWPDFTKDDLFSAIREYQARRRRFGGVDGSD